MAIVKIFLPGTTALRDKLNEFKKLDRGDGQPYHIIIAKRGAVNSFYVSELSVKYVDENATKEVINPLTDKPEKLLSGEYCRFWLKKLYPPFTIPARYNHLKQSVPNWFCGKFINRELVYFDLVGAYHQIYYKLWLDFAEIGMTHKYPLRQIGQELNWWKSARNSLVGNLASNQACQIIGNSWQYVPTWNDDKYYNHLILWFANSLLTELANIALNLGCCYIATDGFIFPATQKWQEFISVLNKYDLKFRCTYGNGSILRFAAYYISGEAIYGDKSEVGTKSFEKAWQSWLDNPISQRDARKERLINRWNRPLKNVTRTNSTRLLEYWSKLK